LHDVPERHRSLRAVIETSWQMLAAEEQMLFRKLAVFRGGFTRAAATQVAGARLPQLMALVDRSLLRLDGDQRFRRHPLLLQFGQEQLTALPEERAQTEASHAHFFADFVQKQEPLLHGAEAPAALATMGTDLENVRLAWQWGLAHEVVAVLDQLVMGIGRFFADRSRFLEGAELFTKSLTVVQEWAVTAVQQQIMAKIQVELGRFWHDNGRFAEAEAILQQALPLTEQHNLSQTRIACLRQLGIVTEDQGRWQVAQAYLEEALLLCRAEGDSDEMLFILNALGNRCVSTGEYEQAQAYFAEAMALAQAVGNTLRIATLYSNIAIIALRQNNNREAIRQWQLARQSFLELNHELGLANTNHNIAMAYAALEQYEEALAHIQQSYAIHEKNGHRRGMAGGLAVMGSIYRQQGKRLEARRRFRESLVVSQEVGVAWVTVGVIVEVAELEISYGELQKAALLLTFALQQPAIGAQTRAKAAELLDELAAELPQGVMAEVATAVQTYTLDSMVVYLVDGRSLT
jgi:tetratricopeptide (TPR) repeat protein